MKDKKSKCCHLTLNVCQVIVEELMTVFFLLSYKENSCKVLTFCDFLCKN